MDDTSPAIRDLLRKRYAAMTGEERLLLGFKSCETAKQIVLSSFPKGLSKKEIRVKLFLRYYSNDFSEEDKQICLLLWKKAEEEGKIRYISKTKWYYGPS